MEHFSQRLLLQLADAVGVPNDEGLELGTHVLAIVAAGYYPSVYVYYDPQMWKCTDAYADDKAHSSFCFRHGLEMIALPGKDFKDHAMIAATVKAVLEPIENTPARWYPFVAVVQRRAVAGGR